MFESHRGRCDRGLSLQPKCLPFTGFLAYRLCRPFLVGARLRMGWSDPWQGAANPRPKMWPQRLDGHQFQNRKPTGFRVMRPGGSGLLLCGSAGRPRPITGAPITGAGLDPSCTPAGIPSNSSDDEGCWGSETAGAETNGVVGVARVVAVPDGGAAVMRVVEPGATAQQLGDPPSILILVADQGRGHWRRHGEKTAGGAAPGYGHGPDGNPSSGPKQRPARC